MSSPFCSPVHTPAWLIAKIDQRLAELDTLTGNVLPALVKLQDYAMVLLPLSEPAEGACSVERERWEHTCDHCGKYGPGTMRCGHVEKLHREIPVVVTLGACPECWDLP